ncbi:MAG: hypothetical protein KJ002_02005 [Candidatus Dadabacteria bacterium]|nr:hypothetical protein [Candidatus Dadabacteria bacterium]
MKKFILCVLGVLAFAAAAEADSDMIMMDTSTAPLGAGETYSTDTFLAESYKYAAVTVVADEDSAGGGVKIEQSCDEDCDTAVEPVFQYVSSWSYTAGSANNQYVAELNCKCARVTYVNGLDAQGSFHLSTYLKLD